MPLLNNCFYLLNIPTVTIIFRGTVYMHGVELGSVWKLGLFWKIKGEVL